MENVTVNIIVTKLKRCIFNSDDQAYVITLLAQPILFYKAFS